MSRDYSVEFEPLGRRVRAAEGETVLSAAQEAGVGLNALCGGKGTCKTCIVRVVKGDVSPPTEAERDLPVEGGRLACQAKVLGELRVEVPPESVSGVQRTQIEGRDVAVELDPTVSLYPVECDPPVLSDVRSDVTRLRDAIRERHGLEAAVCDPAVARMLPGFLRDEDWSAGAAVQRGMVIGLLPRGIVPLGLAVDMGTTKVAVYLEDLDSGKVLASSGSMNPQTSYGEDVMARISAASEGPERARRLQEVLLGHIQEKARELCSSCGRDAAHIMEAVAVGNTCIHHLAMGLPLKNLGLAPYVPVLTDPCDVRAGDLGLEFAPGARVHFFPNVAGFVGGDHVAMLLAAGIHQSEKTTLGLDIGTNTEITLAADGRLWSCSCPSGPAFEGAHIQDGMRAASGAVEWVKILEGGTVRFRTVDDQPPVGICGSGILDAVAELRKAGVLGPTGAMSAEAHQGVQGEGRSTEFVLVRKGEQGARRDIVVTRGDVNEIMLAKAAIRAGIDTLLSEAGLEAGEVERVLIAGAFGTHLHVESTIALGMFPPLPAARFSQVGNAAGVGARMALLSKAVREEASKIAARIQYVELTAKRSFTDTYTKALVLP